MKFHTRGGSSVQGAGRSGAQGTDGVKVLEGSRAHKTREVRDPTGGSEGPEVLNRTQRVQGSCHMGISQNLLIERHNNPRKFICVSKPTNGAPPCTDIPLSRDRFPVPPWAVSIGPRCTTSSSAPVPLTPN